VKRIHTTVGAFQDIAVDFIRTVVPRLRASSDDSSELVRRFLIEQPTGNAQHLAKKAVIGVSPETTFGKCLWP